MAELPKMEAESAKINNALENAVASSAESNDKKLSNISKDLKNLSLEDFAEKHDSIYSCSDSCKKYRNAVDKFLDKKYSAWLKQKNISEDKYYRPENVKAFYDSLKPKGKNAKRMLLHWGYRKIKKDNNKDLYFTIDNTIYETVYSFAPKGVIDLYVVLAKIDPQFAEKELKWNNMFLANHLRQQQKLIEYIADKGWNIKDTIRHAYVLNIVKAVNKNEQGNMFQLVNGRFDGHAANLADALLALKDYELTEAEKNLLKENLLPIKDTNVRAALMKIDAISFWDNIKN